MSRRVFDVDPNTGAVTWFHDDPGGGFHLQTEMDLSPILDANKEIAADKSHWRHGDDFRLEARIPNIVLLDWATKDGVPPHMVYSSEYAKKIVSRLNSSEFHAFKTADVRI